jgi:uncharacterized protein YecE (DUF72 family)
VSDRPSEPKIGCCGFRMARGEYFRRFPVVEVQQTFYQPPKVATLEGWRAEAPAGFEFTVKAWMLVTHEAKSPTYRRLKRSLADDERAECGAFQPTEIVAEAWATTLAAARALDARSVLFQCPASFRPVGENIDNMRDFFTRVAAGTGLEYLWEPRGGWPDPLVRALCDDLGLVHVVDPFAARTVTPERIYFRIHGRRGLPYEDDELEDLAGLVPRDAASHVMFNNVRMVADAERFRAVLSRGDEGLG